MERTGHWQRHRPTPEFTGKLHRPVTRPPASRDDDLPRTVEINGYKKFPVTGFGAKLINFHLVKANNTNHSAFGSVGRRLHRLSSLLYKNKSIFKTNRARSI